jgi:peptidoglycan/LPS O-acetylase OafA/YrhL
MKRVPVIDLVRFASIFVVIGWHFFPRWVATFAHSEWLSQLILKCFLNGAYGVTCFFVVSGFLITQMLVGHETNFSKIDLKSFYVKRAARIFPLLAAVILVGFTLAHLKWLMMERAANYNSWNVDDGFGWAFWISLLTFNFNWLLIAKGFVGFGMHWAVLWSLAVEEQFYLCYPLVVKRLKNEKRVLVFLISVVVFAIAFRVWVFFFMGANTHWMHEASFASFDQIALGGLLYFLQKKVAERLKENTWMAVLVMISGMAVCGYLYVETSFDDGNQAIFVPTLMAAGCALTILGGLYMPGLNTSLVRAFSWPGKLSYGCYLWHPTIIFLLIPVLTALGGLWGLAYLLVSVWFFAFISYKCFEIPLNNRIRAFFGLKPSQSL